jgi:hypothetical protein
LNEFCHLLARASRFIGSVPDVASVLDVPVAQVYRWLAEIDRPSGEISAYLTHRLRAALVAAQSSSL